MTLEAWVRPTNLGSSYRTAIMKEQPGSMSYGLYANSSGPPTAPIGEVYINGYRDAIGTAQLPLNTWTHLATTYNGNVLALYVNGVQAGQLVIAGSLVASTGALKIGGNAIWGEWFQGEIDEVRIYNRALNATEITGDMATSVSNPDASPPSAPGALSVVGGLSSAQLSWGAATDNVGVARYNVHRGTSAGFTPSVGNRIAQPTGLSYTDNVAAGTYFYRVVAEDAAGNLGPASNEASGTVGDTQAPSVPGVVGCGGFGGAGDVVVVGVDGQRWCAALQRASRYERGFCGFGWEPDRAAGDAGLCGSDGAGELLLQGHCRGCGREHQRGFE